MTITTVKDFQGNDIKVVEYMRIEHHSTNLYRTMQADADVLKRCGFTPERFEEVVSHQDVFGSNQKGEAPTEEEQDRFDEVYWEGVECVDSREDMWTDAKGGYEVSYELIEEPTE